MLGRVANYNHPKSSLRSLKAASPDRRGPTTRELSRGGELRRVGHRRLVKTTWIQLKTTDQRPPSAARLCPCLPGGQGTGAETPSWRRGPRAPPLSHLIIKGSRTQRRGEPPRPPPTCRPSALGAGEDDPGHSISACQARRGAPPASEQGLGKEGTRDGTR